MTFDFDSCLDKGRQLQANGASDEDLLRLFRQEGASMFESAKLILKLKGLSAGKANELIHFSETWADCKESQEQLWDDFVEAARQLGAKVSWEKKR